jgi:hypothetical protein
MTFFLKQKTNQLKVCILGIIAVIISGCGSDTIRTSVNNSSTVEAQASDGTGVITYSGEFEGQPTRFVVISDDVATVQDALSGEINTSVVPGSSLSEGVLYNVTRSGITADGSTIVITTVGETLDLLGYEYSSNSIVSIGDSLGFVSGGSPISRLPNGSFSYSGTASVISTLNEAIEDGTFSMTANFSNQSAQITANTDSYFFSASNIAINSNSGKFTDDSGLIGVKDGNSQSAEIIGYFAGPNAEGVHGVTYSDLEASNGYAGLFYGSR